MLNLENCNNNNNNNKSIKLSIGIKAHTLRGLLSCYYQTLEACSHLALQTVKVFNNTELLL